MTAPITIDLSSLKAAAKKIILPDETMKKIMALAVSRTARWAAIRFRNQLAKGTKMTGKVIKGRMRVTISKEGEGHAHIWIGLKPVSLSRFNPVATGSGVTTDVKEVPDGFILPAGGVFKRRGAARLPIDKQFLEIKEKADPIFDRVVSEVEARLGINFERAYLDVLSLKA